MGVIEMNNVSEGLPLRESIIASIVIAGTWIAIILVAVWTCQ